MPGATCGSRTEWAGGQASSHSLRRTDVWRGVPNTGVALVTWHFLHVASRHGRQCNPIPLVSITILGRLCVLVYEFINKTDGRWFVDSGSQRPSPLGGTARGGCCRGHGSDWIHAEGVVHVWCLNFAVHMHLDEDQLSLRYFDADPYPVFGPCCPSHTDVACSVIVPSELKSFVHSHSLTLVP